MNISVIVVCYNEENNIKDCIDSIIDQKYPVDKFEILVIDGNSEDNTREIVEECANKSDNVRMIVNPKRTIASSRNIGILEARYEYIAFTDADCIVPIDWLDKMAAYYSELQKSEIAIVAVGGGNKAPDNYGKFVEAIGISFNTYLSCLGSVQGMNYDRVKEVESIACLNAMYKRDLVLEAGCFNEDLRNLGEDWDLNSRLRQRGYKIFFLPNAEVHHKMRSNIKAFCLQMYRYGYGRAFMMRKSISAVKLMYIMPLFFIIFMSLTPLGLINNWFLFGLLYFPFIIVYSLGVSIREKRLDLFFRTVLIFIIIHFAYSIGETVGLLEPKKIRKESQT